MSETVTAKKAPERNRCLDFFKGVSALSVVFGHIPFPGRFGKCISAVGSCGILLFFLISGYYAYGDGEKMRTKLMKRFRRNLCILLIAVAVYTAVTAVEFYVTHRNMHGFLRPFMRPEYYLRLLLWGDLEPIHGDPLWFLFALLQAYLIFWLMYRLRLQKYAKFAMPVFILLRIGLETYKYAVNGDWRICSNVLAAAVCGIVSLICVFLLVCFDPFRYDISQIFKITAAVSAMLFALQKPALRLIPPLSALGGDCSLHVYLWHMPVIVLAYLICERHSLSQRFYEWYLPPIVAAVSVVIAVLIVTVQSIIKHRQSTAVE